MATSQLFLDTRRAKADSTFPVKIRIGYGRSAKLFSTVYSLNEKEFSKVTENKYLNELQKEMKVVLDALITKADRIIRDLDPFNIDAFTLQFTQRGNKTDLLFLLNQKATRLRLDEKYGNANLYAQAAALLERYNTTLKKTEELPIVSISPRWLIEFENWALKLKRKTKAGETISEYGKTTLGMYLIRVRAIFNEAITNKELNSNLYPFHKADNKNGYRIPKGANNKRPLSMAEIMLIYNYKTGNPNEQFAKDMFIFSYLSSGINAIDIFQLKWSDIQGNTFSFIRRKSKNKPGGANKITINITADLQQIIDNHGSRKIQNSYIFNVVPGDASEKDILRKARSKIAVINLNLKRIAASLDIPSDISTYFARHSFSNISMNNEVPIAFISKQLGHSDIKTTQNYLDSFTTEKATEYQASLLDKKIS